MTKTMKSPCIRMCTLNESDICLGCGRMVNEITSWTNYTDSHRDELIKRSRERLSVLDSESPLLAEARRQQVKKR